jgi:hypothetical protein
VFADYQQLKAADERIRWGEKRRYNIKADVILKGLG